MRRLFVALLLALPALTGCSPADAGPPVEGVSKSLATSRAITVSDLRYAIEFYVPALPEKPVDGRLTATFILRQAGPLVFDFRAPAENVQGIEVDGRPVVYTFPPGHIVIPAYAVKTGRHAITIRFTATDEALNRSDEYLYTLFVPDRASTAFPLFDQPDLKAHYQLSLTVPAGWKAVANGAVESDSASGGRHFLTFHETPPISSYLFAFAAGKFFEASAERDGRTLTMFHRETDSAKVERNRQAIFDLHADALRWLEDYTGIPYPFEKVAFFAIPSFQFGGMEHPGAVWYRAEGLFLDQSATRNQLLGRASLIAHETAHMWFGDLVTMRWFDDVWMKEVFANFMAAKIVQPAFPDIDHQLRFFLAHHPPAYAVDRTLGTNPIRQDLGNLRDAGSLYGAIIYQKAPIVMRQLELLLGEEEMRAGLRTYLDRFRYGNATWLDLIEILDQRTPEDLRVWSRSWVEQKGRPTIRASWEAGILRLRQDDPDLERHLRWSQPVGVSGWNDSSGTLTIPVTTDEANSPTPNRTAPEYLLPGADGVSYGRFVIDSTTRAWLLHHLPELRTPLLRAVGWSALWEAVLDGGVPPKEFLSLAVAALPVETNELVIQQILGLLRGVYWRFLDAGSRATRSAEVESVLWTGLERATTPSLKGAYFGALTGVSGTNEGLARLQRIWSRRAPPPGLPLSEQQYTSLAEALAIRGVANTNTMLDEQERRITNPDRLAQFRFVRPALSADSAQRDSVFQSFRQLENRRRESWVLDAVAFLNHPLRARSAVSNIEASLDLAEEIQRTGDIFFPLRWLNATLDGHQSVEAATIVAGYLETHPDLSPRLRGKILQAADDLFRAARIVHGWRGGPVLEGDRPGN